MNKLIKLSSIFCLGLAISACATAPATSNVGPVTAKTSLGEQTKDVTEWKTAKITVSDGTERVCKRIQQPATRFTKKVCRTQAEWDRLSDAAKNLASKIQRGGALQGNGGGE